MPQNQLVGTSHRQKHCKHHPVPAVKQDLVSRKFAASKPNQIRVTDITRQQSAERWVHWDAVLAGCGRRIRGWSIADYVRSEFVVGALQMAKRRRY